MVKKPNREKELSKKESERKPAPENQYKKPEETEIKETMKEGDKLQPDMTNPVFPEKKETKPVKKEFDWSMFDDEPAEESTKTNTNNSVKVEKKNDIKGTAAEGVTPNQQKNIGTKSKSSSDNPVVSEVSGKTKGALSGIKNVTVKGDGGRSEISFKGSDGDGGYFMDMGGGGDSDTGGRGIISPKKPTITLSDYVISEIDVTKTVTVHFTVLPDGNVVEVYVTPAATLPDSVVKEIKEQVSSWRFRSSIFKSQGEFKYTIKVN